MPSLAASRTLRASRIVLLLALAAGPLAGCEDAVDPTLGTDQVFTLYGYLDPTADRQAVRVIPIDDRITADPSETIDVVVTSTDEGTGRVVVWRDSVVTYADGSIGHVFVADNYTPAPQSRVRFEARRSDGKTATVTLDVPPVVQAVSQPPQTSLNEVTYVVRFDGVPRVNGGELRLRVLGMPGAPADTTELIVPSTVAISEVGAGTWEVEIPFLTTVRTFLNTQNLGGARLTLLDVRYVGFVTNAEWVVPPGGFDPNVIVEPGTFSNVTGGFGFVGAGYESVATWLPSVNTQSRAGFATSVDAASLVRINEVSLDATPWIEFYNTTLEPVDLGGYRVSNDAENPGLFEIPSGSVVPGRGFLAVDVPFQMAAGQRVILSNRSNAEVRSLPVEDGEGGTYGSYPDGRAYKFAQGGPEVFRQPLTPTRGAPNRPREQPAVINEISSTGSDGWVEVVLTGTSQFSVSSLRLSSRSDRMAEAVPTDVALPFGVANETPLSLELPQGGGEVYLMVDYERSDGSVVRRVVDYRAFGPQIPLQSIGFLPDGPSGTWRESLVPTRGAPNAGSGRLARR